PVPRVPVRAGARRRGPHDGQAGAPRRPLGNAGGPPRAAAGDGRQPRRRGTSRRVNRRRLVRIAAAGAGALAAATAVGGALAASACYRASSALLVPHRLPVSGGGLDPWSTQDLRFRTVTIREPLGPAPAWLVLGGQ